MQLMTNSPTQRVYRPPTTYMWRNVGDIFICGSFPLETIAESSEEDNDENEDDHHQETTKEKEEFIPHLLSGEGCKEEEKAKSQ
jgi:hypothetical protein